ncbi:MAG: hypothetical protein Q8R53_02215 [Nanoarchaeota archaeon]|nr:hypothetical protein [Nanoarchaeota archaeon]
MVEENKPTLGERLANFGELADFAKTALSPWEGKQVDRPFSHRHHLTRENIFGHVAVVMWEESDIERGLYWRAAFRLLPGQTWRGDEPDNFFCGPRGSQDYVREQADAILTERGFTLYNE